MKNLIFVGLGGFLGAITRYKLGGLILHNFRTTFPLGTVIINIAGCFFIGFLSEIMVKEHLFSSETRLFLVTGLLGGFTTFSAFGFETIYLMKRGDIFMAFMNIGLSVLLGLFAVWLGWKTGLIFKMSNG
ncbi:MAG: fluoride efflux transporter CrcB [Candidatus Theseobacter exili]|nr:fluoride efflux transporter CrcB [Candidatus Theseobacter exili]